MTEIRSGHGADHHRHGDANGGRPTGHPEHTYDSGSSGAVVDMTTRLAGVELPNPVMTASGCAAAGRELDQFFPVDELGAVVTKSIMLAPRAGRATPRMAETPSGMLNSIGLQGQGIDQLCASDLRWLRDRGARAVVSIAGGSVEEYAKIAGRLGDEISRSGTGGAKDGAIALVEVNISCPNVEDRGQVFACDPVAAGAVVEAVRAELPGRVPVFAKLSPDVTDVVSIGRACVAAGADGLSAINTLLGMVIDVDSMRPALAGLTGGLSGPRDTAGGGALHLAAARRAARRTDHWCGWDQNRPGCARARARRCFRGPGGNDDLSRPWRSDTRPRRASRCPRGTWVCSLHRLRRVRPPPRPLTA